ncbi:MAG: large repetitive protein [Mycobacterium sp.]|nr:large repetitive protein [Mycobacterium sp.]
MRGVSGYARSIGRVGALAVAFGVGVAVVTMPGVAWADQDSTSGSSADAQSPAPDPAAPTAPDSPGPDAPEQELPAASGDTGTSETVSVGDSPDVTYGNSGGAHTSDETRAGGDAHAVSEQTDPPGPVESAAPPHVEAAPPVGAEAPPAPRAASAPARVDRRQNSGAASWGEGAAPVVSRRSAAPVYVRPAEEVGLGLAVGASSAPANHSAAASGQMAMSSARKAVAAPVGGPETGLNTVSDTLLNVASGLLVAVFAPLVVPGPTSPADTPLLWAVMGWARRQFGNQTSDLVRAAPDATDELGNVKITLNTTDADNAAAGHRPAGAVMSVPIAAPIRPSNVTSTVDPDTGWVSGYVFAENPDDDRVSYGGTGPTLKGSVVVYEDASFLYKPSDAARRDATATGGDLDTFTITVDDGRGASRFIPVTVDVLPEI